MVPVNITEEWYDNHGLAVLQQLRDLMIRPKRFIGLLILGITALITAITSVAVATVSLTQQIHTANHVNQLSRNVSVALATQESIDRHLEQRVDALEEAIIHSGNELQSLKVRLSLSCHANYKWICVTPLEVNQSQFEWNKYLNQLKGIWNHSDLSLDISKLHEQIQNIEQTKLDFTVAQTANDLYTSFSSFVSGKNLLSTSLTYVALGTIVLILILLFPCFFRLISSNIKAVANEVNLLALKNKKGRDVGSHAG